MGSRIPVRAVVQRQLRARPEEVYDAWLSRSRLTQWMVGPLVRDEEIVHLALDPRVGGTFSFHVEREGEDVELQGRYLELARPDRLAFTWLVAGEPLGSRVLVEIEASGGGAILRVTQEMHPAWADRAAEVAADWARRLDVLEKVLAADCGALPRRTGGG